MDPPSRKVKIRVGSAVLHGAGVGGGMWLQMDCFGQAQPELLELYCVLLNLLNLRFPGNVERPNTSGEAWWVQLPPTLCCPKVT